MRAYLSSVGGQDSRGPVSVNSHLVKAMLAKREARVILDAVEPCSPDGTMASELDPNGASFYSDAREMTPLERIILIEALTRFLED